MKSVLVVGVGPAGLVAGKTLLQSNDQFEVTIVDSKDRLGGMWGVQKDGPGDKCSAQMPTNLSRFTVSFSDLDWASVGLKDESGSPLVELPFFPKAWQVGMYLEEYARRYIPAGVFRFNTTVVDSRRDIIDGVAKWTVSLSTEDGAGESTVMKEVYDFVVVATGFFQNPGTVPILRPAADDINYLSISRRVKHSSLFRSIPELLESRLDPEGKIVVIGGGISGSEAAAALAFEISDTQNSPSHSPSCASDLDVYHITARPFYCLRKFLPSPVATPSSKFVPLDLALYNLDGRLQFQDPIVPMNGRKSPAEAQNIHSRIRSIAGPITHPALLFTEDDERSPPFTGIVDSYPEFVRSGRIHPIRGRLTDVLVDEEEDPTGFSEPTEHLKLVVKDQQGRVTDVEKVVAVIDATGFRAGIPWLPDDVCDALDGPRRDKIGSDPGFNRIPYILHDCMTYNSKIPDLGFVGYYEGPFWGVIELQARLVAKQLLGLAKQACVTMAPSEQQDQQCTELSGFRDAIRAGDRSVPQFVIGDYVGVMEAYNQELDIQRNDGFLPADLNSKGPVTSARYADPAGDQHQVHSALGDLMDVICLSWHQQSRSIAAAVFTALHGSWSAWRITSRPGAPHQFYLSEERIRHRNWEHRTFSFHPRRPTNPNYAAEYVFQGYFGYNAIWRLNDSAGCIEVWDVARGTSQARFHRLRITFIHSDGQSNDDYPSTGCMVAQVDDLLVPSLFSRFALSFEGANLNSILGIYSDGRGVYPSTHPDSQVLPATLYRRNQKLEGDGNLTADSNMATTYIRIPDDQYNLVHRLAARA